MHAFVLLSIDLGLVALSTLLALPLRDNLATSAERAAEIAPFVLITLAAAIPVFLAAGLNRTVWRFSSLTDCVRVAGAVVVTAVLAVTAAAMLDLLGGAAGSLPIIQVLLAVVLLTGIRAAMRLRHAARRWRNVAKSLPAAGEAVLVVGLNPTAELFLRCVAESTGERIAVAGLLAGRDRHRGRLLRSHPVLGAPEELARVLDELEVHGVFIDRVVVAIRFEQLSSAAQDALRHAERTRGVRIEVLAVPMGLGEATTAGCSAESVPARSLQLGAAAARAVDVQELASRPYWRWKRVLDFLAAVILVVFFAPLMLLILLVVMLDVGYPPIFWQQRPGTLGAPIRVLKFRTMRPMVDEHGRRLADVERTSAVGRLLRRLRLDELPQLYNVLIGEMSFVGPRPLLPIDQSPGSVARLAIRPGLTGWAQINGGRDLSVDDKAALDIWYIRNASFRLDMLILASTLRTVLVGESIDQDAVSQAWRELGCPDVRA